MISTSHVNAQEMFERDVNGVVKFFAMKMRYVPEPEEIPNFAEVPARWALSQCVWSVGRSVGGFVCCPPPPPLSPSLSTIVDSRPETTPPHPRLRRWLGRRRWRGRTRA